MWPSANGETSIAKTTVNKNKAQSVTEYFQNQKEKTKVKNADVRIGDIVTTARRGTGIVRYVGTLPKRVGKYVGIELEQPLGKHNGQCSGKQFFTCKRLHGVFVKYNTCRLIPAEKLFWALKNTLQQLHDIDNKTQPSLTRKLSIENQSFKGRLEASQVRHSKLEEEVRKLRQENIILRAQRKHETKKDPSHELEVAPPRVVNRRRRHTWNDDGGSLRILAKLAEEEEMMPILEEEEEAHSGEETEQIQEPELASRGENPDSSWQHVRKQLLALNQVKKQVKRFENELRSNHRPKRLAEEFSIPALKHCLHCGEFEESEIARFLEEVDAKRHSSDVDQNQLEVWERLKIRLRIVKKLRRVVEEASERGDIENKATWNSIKRKADLIRELRKILAKLTAIEKSSPSFAEDKENRAESTGTKCTSRSRPILPIEKPWSDKLTHVSDASTPEAIAYYPFGKVHIRTQSLPISMFKSGSRYSNPFAQKISFHTRIKSSDAVDLPFEISPESKQENYQDDEEIITSDSFGALSDDFEDAVENLVTLINEDENRLDTLDALAETHPLYSQTLKSMIIDSQIPHKDVFDYFYIHGKANIEQVSELCAIYYELHAENPGPTLTPDTTLTPVTLTPETVDTLDIVFTGKLRPKVPSSWDSNSGISQSTRQSADTENR